MLDSVKLYKVTLITENCPDFSSSVFYLQLVCPSVSIKIQRLGFEIPSTVFRNALSTSLVAFLHFF